MYDGVVPHIDAYMTAVANDIAGLSFCKADTVTAASKSCRAVRKAYAEVCIYTHDKSGTVGSVGQTGAAVYVRVADELTCKSCHCIAGSTSAAAAADRTGIAFGTALASYFGLCCLLSGLTIR